MEDFAEPGRLKKFALVTEKVVYLEFFIENGRLATTITSLSIADKMVLYQYYYSELNDVEIGSCNGKTSQGVKEHWRGSRKHAKRYKKPRKSDENIFPTNKITKVTIVLLVWIGI
ncbi:hypothetical protein [Lactiplantibacillus mudanjiangensis]|uniref:RNA polymerase subunit sigma-70 [Lactobacillus paracasei] n=1 Tax=Lactiplantibacillus mudanjiangensis TaxID=1296538 RepID=A0A660DTX0_9LACO|nr:hypothetical protein [Lactiplantibacillus mudanjiangensis]VDG22805.1 RNA polymerase subunit sigma-70 [Lactobacillus paracasei] [Lactiplantibacillus mudanjiangensis]VDG26624.1 RNA polymerase subunit sigma-70 [Lactobacillus paracasei] [Lactiplantibacillus mudanjiangensis]